MTTAFWIAATTVAVLWILLLRVSVRVLGKSLDNGWDNAIGYAIATGLLAIPVHWMVGTRSWLVLLVPLVVLVGQTLALRVIYEIHTAKAVLLGAFHFAVTSLVVGGLTIIAGAVAAYVLYGKIISDPLWLVMLVLRLIGIELPFEAPPPCS